MQGRYQLTLIQIFKLNLDKGPHPQCKTVPQDWEKTKQCSSHLEALIVTIYFLVVHNPKQVCNCAGILKTGPGNPYPSQYDDVDPQIET